MINNILFDPIFNRIKEIFGHIKENECFCNYPLPTFPHPHYHIFNSMLKETEKCKECGEDLKSHTQFVCPPLSSGCYSLNEVLFCEKCNHRSDKWKIHAALSFC